MFKGVLSKKNKRDYIEDEHNPHLMGISGVYEGTRVELTDEIAIGRDSRVSQLIIQRSDISRKHCTVSYERSSGMYIVTDLSESGTYVIPERRLSKNVPVRLAQGTVIRVGDKNEVFKLG